MPLERIGEYPIQRNPCQDRQHNPPSLIKLSPGIYRWTCPSCGQKKVFVAS